MLRKTKFIRLKYYLRSVRGIIWCVFICSLLSTSNLSYAKEKNSPPPKTQSLKFAGKLIQKEKFDEAVKYLRVMVRKNRKNYNAWTMLGVSYFHTGLPKRALKILKYSDDKVKGENKSYNHYYQGLAYDALKNRRNSQRYFQKVAVSNSPYADPSCFELSASYYNAKKAPQASKWINYYIQKFPGGRYISKVMKMKKNMDKGKFGKKISGIKKPNLEKALFKYSSLSLMDSPHFWFMEFGGKFTLETGFEPNSVLTRQERSDEILALDLKTGFGLGPFRRKKITAYAGYTYDQEWNATQERTNIYVDDPSDLAYFPFRPDLLERGHTFYSDIRANLGGSIYTGLFLKYKLTRYGSDISGPEDWSIEESYTTNSASTFIPWIGKQWNRNHRSLFYWFFDKNIDYETEDFSRQSYSFGFDEVFPISIGISHSSEIPSISSTFNLELYKYEFIFPKDPYKDHNRIGVLGSLAHQLIPTVDLDLTAGYYQDTYIEPRIRVKNCSFVSSTEETDTASTSSDAPKSCPRIDTGYIFGAQISWAYRQFYRIFAKMQFLQNQNDDLQEFGFEQQSFLGGITLAFPSVKRTVRYSERFADRALEKGIRP